MVIIGWLVDKPNNMKNWMTETGEPKHSFWMSPLGFTCDTGTQAAFTVRPWHDDLESYINNHLRWLHDYMNISSSLMTIIELIKKNPLIQPATFTHVKHRCLPSIAIIIITTSVNHSSKRWLLVVADFLGGCGAGTPWVERMSRWILQLWRCSLLNEQDFVKVDIGSLMLVDVCWCSLMLVDVGWCSMMFIYVHWFVWW